MARQKRTTPVGSRIRMDYIHELAVKHGYNDSSGQPNKHSSKGVSKHILTRAGEPESGEDLADLPKQLDGIWYKNRPFYDLMASRFGFMGFSFETKTIDVKGETQQVVVARNWPTRDGEAVTLAEAVTMNPHDVDGYLEKGRLAKWQGRIGTTAGFDEHLRRMRATGVGYSGMSGVSWLPGIEPFTLPSALGEHVVNLGQALFEFYDVVDSLYNTGDPLVCGLLNLKVPARIPRLNAPGKMSLLRPDQVLVESGGTYRVVATELESCPGGQGMMHAIQVGHQAPLRMVEGLIRILKGRPYYILATHQWAEYTWEQAAYVKALRENGVDARLIFDAPLREIHDNVASSWKTPKGAPPHVHRSWNNDYLGRLQEQGFTDFVFGAEELPDDLGDCLIFRFGYFDNFSVANLERMVTLQERGAEFLNPPKFWLENKALMAALGLNPVRERLREESLAVLDQGIATTWLLEDKPDMHGMAVENQDFLLTKFGAWDGDNQSWGSRSVQVGKGHGNESWKQLIRDRSRLPFPVVLQHTINSAKVGIAYVDHVGAIQLLTDARTRLTPFYFREGDQANEAGSLITVRSKSFRVHGATDAAELLVEYRDTPNEWETDSSAVTNATNGF